MDLQVEKWSCKVKNGVAGRKMKSQGKKWICMVRNREIEINLATEDTQEDRKMGKRGKLRRWEKQGSREDIGNWNDGKWQRIRVGNPVIL